MSGEESLETADEALGSDEARRRYGRLSEIVAAARQLAGASRDAYLRAACAEDSALEAEAESWLREIEAHAPSVSGRDAVRGTIGRAAAQLIEGDSSEGTPARVGSYRIESEIGKGGMGVVYKGFDEKLGRPVAIKAVPPALTRRPELRVRLEREARRLAILSHPNIATIFGMEEHDGQLYLILEYLDGETLATRLERAPLEPRMALGTCLKIAEGLHSAHRQGVIHRDVKPANVMVTHEGVIKLLDFGLARTTTRDDVEISAMTEAGAVMGTPGYMSPEQIRGDAVGPATDVWSFACVLYECVSGERLWSRSSVSQRLRAILEEPPVLGRLPPAVPPEIVDLLRRCLEKNPKHRPQDFVEVIQSLSAGITTDSLPRNARKAGNLNPERDAFVGRNRELGELGERLERGTSLLTVLGTGKTRLVQHYGLANAAAWPAGVWFCDLAEARGIDGIVRAVATALGVPIGRDPVTQIGEVIAGRRRCLVILDNFEQVIEHASTTLARWLDHAGDAVFVVTSRVRLELPGEEVYALEPLDVEAEGVELFTVRARRQRPGFSLTPENRGAVTDVVRLLDGLPLAIELAAARMRILSLEQLYQRLDDRFRLLIGGKPGSRHASLAATLDWSWHLLSEWKQAALGQLSVFEGGFTLDAAEVVVELGSWMEAPPVLDVLEQLVDRSLLRTTVTADAALRFSMLVSVQAYAKDKLSQPGAIAKGESGPSAQARSELRHAKWFARFGRDDAVDSLYRHGGVERVRALGHELDNLVVACRRPRLRRRRNCRDDTGRCVGDLAPARPVRSRRGTRARGDRGAGSSRWGPRAHPTGVRSGAGPLWPFRRNAGVRPDGSRRGSSGWGPTQRGAASLGAR